MYLHLEVNLTVEHKSLIWTQVRNHFAKPSNLAVNLHASFDLRCAIL
jgi:hypothetical protein